MTKPSMTRRCVMFTCIHYHQVTWNEPTFIITSRGDWLNISTLSKKSDFKVSPAWVPIKGFLKPSSKQPGSEFLMLIYPPCDREGGTEVEGSRASTKTPSIKHFTSDYGRSERMNNMFESHFSVQCVTNRA